MQVHPKHPDGNMRLMWGIILCVVAFIGCAEKESVRPPLSLAPTASPLSGGKVQWSRWEERDSARSANRPILLFLYSQRAFWCRDLVERCFDNAYLAREIQRITFPVRVDADHRPDLFERYGMGGLPSVVFLKPDGALITGSTYLDSMDLDDLLRRVFILSDNEKRMAALEAQREELKRRARLWAEKNPRPVLDLTPVLMTRVVDSVQVAALRGEDLGAESLLALVESEIDTIRQIGIRALLSTAKRLQDVDGAFFLASLTADGDLVDREKHLGMNAEWLLAFARAAQLTGHPDLLAVAETLGDGLRSEFQTERDSLLSAGWTSWGNADGQALRDPAIYAGWNAAAISGLVALYQVKPSSDLLTDCQRIFAGLMDRFRTEDGFFLRVEGAQRPVFLEDQTLVLRASLDLYEATQVEKYLIFARALADGILENFVDVSGAFKDRAPEFDTAIAPVIDRWLPSGNGVGAQGLIRLSIHSGDLTYRAAAGRLITTLCGPHIDDFAFAGALVRGMIDFWEMDTLHGKP